MLFKVTHIDVAGHRHRARVSAPNPTHAMDQMEQVFGVARGGGCLRLVVKPALRLVGGVAGVRPRFVDDIDREFVCGL